MIALYPMIIMSVIQGIAEFLPVSSQAHLILFPYLMGMGEHDRFLDVAIHLGTLFAVLIYFRKDIKNLFMKGFLNFFKRKLTIEGKSVLFLLTATLPSIFIGYIIHKIGEDFLRGIPVIAYSSIGFGLLLYLVDRYFPENKPIKNMTVYQAFFVGCMQVFALIPGASRSGTTITGARFLGFSRTEATRFSFLMSIPVVVGALVLTGADMYQQTGLEFFTGELAVAILVSFLSGYLAIAFLMRWISTHSFAPFMIYRILLGLFLLGIVYF